MLERPTYFSKKRVFWDVTPLHLHFNVTNLHGFQIPTQMLEVDWGENDNVSSFLKAAPLLGFVILIVQVGSGIEESPRVSQTYSATQTSEKFIPLATTLSF